MLVAVSPVYETAPWGGVEQDDFLNAVLIVADPDIDAWGWLRRGQALEQAAGRVARRCGGARGPSTSTSSPWTACVAAPIPSCCCRTRGTPERATVLRPWLDVDPDAVLPGHGPVADAARRARPGRRGRHATAAATTVDDLVPVESIAPVRLA